MIDFHYQTLRIIALAYVPYLVWQLIGQVQFIQKVLVALIQYGVLAPLMFSIAFQAEDILLILSVVSAVILGFWGLLEIFLRKKRGYNFILVSMILSNLKNAYAWYYVFSFREILGNDYVLRFFFSIQNLIFVVLFLATTYLIVRKQVIINMLSSS